LEHRVAEVEQHAEERLISLEMARKEVESGYADLEKQFGDLKLEVNRINRFLECENMNNSQDKVGIFGATDADADHRELGSSSACQEHLHRTQGMSQSDPFPRASELSHDHARGHHSFPHLESQRSGKGRLPKLKFLVFHGEDPQLRRFRCENYYDMYVVESSLWVRVASMHMEGSAARWLQSMERRIKGLSWGEFCALVHERFGRDQHEAFIRQLFHIRQTGSVTEYVDKFSVLVDQLMAYEEKANPLHYAMRFVDGLKEDVKSMVMIQRPSNLDVACALALVQEEAMDCSKMKDYRRYDSSSSRTFQGSMYSASCT
jgi:hypothetical protein